MTVHHRSLQMSVWVCVRVHVFGDSPAASAASPNRANVDNSNEMKVKPVWKVLDLQVRLLH